MIQNKIDEFCLLKNIKIFSDLRGSFYESFKKTDDLILSQNFVQHNHSISKRNVIRGLHYQWDYPMGKLVRVSRGSIVDVIVDIRSKKETFGAVYYFELNDKNLHQLWVPAGFAHGFISLEDDTHVEYMCSSIYNKDGESGLNPFDTNLSIDWGIDIEKAICSEKDLNAKSFFQYKKEPKF